jgi:hypothetical protein
MRNFNSFQANDRFGTIISELSENHPPKIFNEDADLKAMQQFNQQMSSIQRDYQAKEQRSLALASKVRLK